ncbi:hypothetical protein [Nocardia sp. NPDC059239]|uniref:DUF7065 domain-containing protein n=1 Tax=unclassified Nocardia TaxID=2637762 RepID=UPI0036817638
MTTADTSEIPDVVEHDETSEWAHESDGTEWWQEGVAISWRDPHAGIGGFLRIGHEPNHAGGLTVVTGGVVTDTGTSFRRNSTSPLGPRDRLTNGFGALDGAYRHTYDGGLRIEVDDNEFHADLVVDDFYARTDFFPKDAGSLVDEIASNHFETSGRITGQVTLDGRTFEVDGLCHRDHSWGVRRWETILNHRWCPVTFGPDLSLGCIVWHALDGSLGGYGYVVRDGVVTRTQDVHVLLEMEADGMSAAGATATIGLPDGDRYVLRLDPGPVLLSEHHGVAWVDAVGSAVLDGRVGFGDLEYSTNPRAGTGPVTRLLRGQVGQGLQRAAG